MSGRLLGVVLVLGGMLSCTLSFGWGREGHETIAKIAERNLDTRARKTIERYLGNHSIVYYAKWMDDYRRTPEYKFTHTWHTAQVDSCFTYSPRKTGDALYGLNSALEILADHKAHSDSTVAVNLKYVIHIVADMHCPAHIQYLGRPKDFDVVFGGGYLGPKVNISMHSIWDKAAIQSCRIWSVSEYAEELDRLSEKEIRRIVAGSPEDWLRDNAERCAVQFDMATDGSVLGQDFVNAAMPLIETQMLYAGYRLAAVLNDLF